MLERARKILGGREEGGVSGSGHELDACVDTALLGFIQKVQKHAKGDFVGGMSEGMEAEALAEDDWYCEAVGLRLDRCTASKRIEAGGAGEAAKRRGLGAGH